MKMTNKNILVFTYGTLKRGGWNHHYLKDAKFVGEAKVKGTLYLRRGFCYPVLFLDGDTDIHGEVYEVDKRGLQRMDDLEGVPNLYKRKQITTSDGTVAWVYYADSNKVFRKSELELIPDGNFVVYSKRGK